jgi:hypothetical protein
MEMATDKWSDARLDAYRRIGDPEGDAVVERLFEGHTVYKVWDLIKKLVQNDQDLDRTLPDFVTEYLDGVKRMPPFDATLVGGGQQLFERYGLEVLVVLACYSLPASYAARKGVQVLHRTAYLSGRANYRLFETSQMVCDVLSPGGLSPGGRGIRTAQKVRLLHAGVRRLILTDPERTWDIEELGVPINQEDLAGTLMVFTHIIADGLEKLGIRLTAQEQQGFLEAWRAIARLVGVQEPLIPASMEEAKELCDIIQRRQVETSPEGIQMTRALLDMMKSHSPPGFAGWPIALMRHLIPPDAIVALDIPPASEWQMRTLQRIAARRASSSPDQPSLFRKMALRWIQSIITAELGGKRTPFIIPTTLHHGSAALNRPGVWEQLRRR